MFLHLATTLYDLLLHLYPPSFRAQFAEEMQSVFAEAMAEAAASGSAAVALACWRELRDAPGAIIHAHWRERSHLMDIQSLERTSRWGLLAALAVFPFAAMAGIVEGRPLGVHDAVLYGAVVFGLLGSVIILLTVGVIKGLPVWSLPSAGLFLAVFTFWLGFQDLRQFTSWVVSTGPGKYFVWLYLPYPPISQIINSGSLWLSLLAMLILIVLAAAALPPLRPFYQRLRRDWTLLSFTVYGAALLGLYNTFDEYRHEEPYLIAGVLLLAVGAWIYLRSSRLGRRSLTLFAALTLAMAAATIGKWLIVPIQDWPTGSGLHPPGSSRWPEALPTVVTWGWIMVVMATPALLALLPRPRQVSDSP